MSGDRYSISDQNDLYFLTFTVVFWMDVFTRKEYKHIIVESLNYCIKEKGLNIFCWCLMSNHLHLIASAREYCRLSDIIRDFKKFTAKKIISEMKTINESRQTWLISKFEYAGKNLSRIEQYKFWKDGSHAIVLNGAVILQQKLDYIHHNPVAADIVEEPHYYKYSSAIDYANGKGLVNILKV